MSDDILADLLEEGRQALIESLRFWRRVEPELTDAEIRRELASLGCDGVEADGIIEASAHVEASAKREDET